MKKVEITKALEVLKEIKKKNPGITFDNMTSDRALDLAIETLVMQYDRAE